MKGLAEFIAEAQANDTVKELFDQIDKRLKYQDWGAVAPLIENIFKNKWGKAIKVDDNPKKKLDLHGNPVRTDYGFRKAIDNGAQNLLLGYNVKGKAWIIVRYNARAHGVRGAIYDGDRVAGIGIDGPVYWSSIDNMIEKAELKLKLRFGEAYEEPAQVIANSFDMEHYDFED